tara:strand:+ start:282 stop:959 length:678 start_codon:yes stop_codon:yes gene_type:complete
MTNPPETLPNEKLEYTYYHWGPFLFHASMTPRECQIVLEVGDKCRKKSNDHRQHLAGHLKEEYKIPDPAPIAAWLKKYFQAYASGFDKWTNKTPHSVDFGLTSMWINYMRAHDFNPPHSHIGDISFVLYPHVPTEITKENKDFKGTVCGPGGISWVYGQGSTFTISVQSCMPKTGDLFIFPASLQHWVYPFSSDVERISVSGNVVMMHPDNTKQVKKHLGGAQIV